MLRRLLAVLAVAAVPLSLAACGGATNGPVSLTLDDNGQTVAVPNGQRLVLTLTGNNWSVSLNPPFGPLAEQSSQLSSAGGTALTTVYEATKTGNATISATRSGCHTSACKSSSAFVVHITVTR